MEQRGLRVLDVDKTFFSKLSSTISKILIPTKIGLNGMLINLKRNNLLKAYEPYIEIDEIEDINKKEQITKKYEDMYALYLESIDKFVMDSIYKKVKNGTASTFEKNALSKYYGVVQLKQTEYVEYKYRKQKYLLELDYESIVNSDKEKMVNKYKKFYASKMETLFKGILKNYAIQLADKLSNYTNKEEIYGKIFSTLEDYISNILPIKIKQNEEQYEDIVNEYEKYEKFAVGKLDKRDCIERNMILLGISRKLFTHSLPLAVAEQCYEKLLSDARELVADTKIAAKKEKSYEMLINLIEDYNIKLLSTKIYWDKPSKREEYKNFWNKYKEITKLKEVNFVEYIKQKEILFIRNDMKQLPNDKKDYSRLLKYYKEKLVKYGDMRQLKNSYKTYGEYTKKLKEKEAQNK